MIFEQLTSVHQKWTEEELKLQAALCRTSLAGPVSAALMRYKVLKEVKGGLQDVTETLQEKYSFPVKTVVPKLCKVGVKHLINNFLCFHFI